MADAESKGVQVWDEAQFALALGGGGGKAAGGKTFFPFIKACSLFYIFFSLSLYYCYCYYYY